MNVLTDLMRSLEDQLEVAHSMTSESGTSEKVCVDEKFILTITISNPLPSEGQASVAFRNVRYMLDDTEYAALITEQTDWKTLDQNLEPGQSREIKVDMIAKKDLPTELTSGTHNLRIPWWFPEPLVKLHMTGDVDPASLFRISKTETLRGRIWPKPPTNQSS